MMRVLRSDLLMDIGKPINPGIDRGQITGAFIQGMGWLTNEELRYDAQGNAAFALADDVQDPEHSGRARDVFNVALDRRRERAEHPLEQSRRRAAAAAWRSRSSWPSRTRWLRQRRRDPEDRRAGDRRGILMRLTPYRAGRAAATRARWRHRSCK